MKFEFSYLMEVIPKVLSKLGVTLRLSLVALVFAVIIGITIAIIAYYKIKVLYPISRVYVHIMRSTPMIVQMYFFYYGIALYSELIRNMKPETAVSIVLSLNIGAFMSESFRAALLSVDDGQKEAAYSLGMTNSQLVRRIILPQAFRIALPPLSNDVINLIKGSSLAFTIGVIDIMGAAKIEGAQTFRYFEVYAAVMLVYLGVISLFSLLHKYLEKRCANAY